MTMTRKTITLDEDGQGLHLQTPDAIYTLTWDEDERSLKIYLTTHGHAQTRRKTSRHPKKRKLHLHLSRTKA